MNNVLAGIRGKPVTQQPDWEDTAQVELIRTELATLPPLVRAGDVRALRRFLAQAAAGEMQVVQAGDCAEDMSECTPGYIARKLGLLDLLAGTIKMAGHKPVVRVGRIGGQFAKPRSKSTELIGGRELPAYRGHLVNGPEPDPDSRRPDPRRMLNGYLAASVVMDQLGWRGPALRPGADPPVWTSHEALLLDYEIPLVRRDESGQAVLTSTHWPWIGERTRDVDGAHVALLASVVNPVACKVGPRITVDELLALCERLDPARERGRLTLIARLGAELVADRLPPLVAAVRAAGHPVLWLCDPMHGNTIVTPDGLKTRLVDTMAREIGAFQPAVAAAGGMAAGLHLETTPDEVTECAWDGSQLGRVGEKYTSFCDPRLNPGQAVSLAAAWRG